MLSAIHVECYSSHRADQRPLRFTMRGRVFEVADVQDQWYSPDAKWFRVQANDGHFYVLRHDQARDQWTLDAFRAARSEVTP